MSESDWRRFAEVGGIDQFAKNIRPELEPIVGFGECDFEHGASIPKFGQEKGDCHG